MDNRNTLAEKNAEIAKRLDQALAMRNQLYEANRKHTWETYELKQQIKSLEEEKAKLQEQLQLAQTCKYSNMYRVVLGYYLQNHWSVCPCIGPSGDHDWLVAAA